MYTVFIEIPILRQYLPVNFVSGSVPVCFMSVNLSPSLYSVYLLHVFFVSLSLCLPVYCIFSLFFISLFLPGSVSLVYLVLLLSVCLALQVLCLSVRNLCRLFVSLGLCLSLVSLSPCLL